MSECYRRTSGCTLPGGHDKSECPPVQAAAERVQAFLTAYASSRGLDPEIIYGYNDREVRTSDLRLLLEAIQ